MLHQPKIPSGYKVSQKTVEGLFQPQARGSLSKALATKTSLQKIAPESPRPSEMLEGVIVTGRDELTADDQHLHDFLIDRAYSGDNLMSAETHSMDMAEAIRFLGSRVERSDIRASLARLKRTTVSYGQSSERRFEDVQLLEGWIEVAPGEDVIRYRLPESLRILMRNMPSYAYIELAALPKMRSKFSSRLYKRFALAAKEQPWVPGDDNTLTLTGTPDEVSDWIGFPKEAKGRVHVGKLRARFLKKVEADFADVRAFRLECSPRVSKARGNPITEIDFILHLAPPSRHTVPMFFKPSEDVARVSHKDVIQYRVESRVWRRAAKPYGRRLAMTNRQMADLWQIALNEALSEVALSDEFNLRQFRGRKLLEAINSRGADYAAWGFITEEADVPDLSTKQLEPGYGTIEREADEARLERIGMGKRKRAAKAAPAFITQEEDEGEPESDVVTFDTAKEIVFHVDEALTALDVETLVGGPIQKMNFTGERRVLLTFQFMSMGRPDTWQLGRYPVSEADIDTIQKLVGRYLDDHEEYR
ncbi:RepB family plasmid replication initiator protein [Mesorhizobium sp. A623]